MITHADFQHLLSEYARMCCQAILCQAIECELQEWMSLKSGATDSCGRQHIVRNGYLPERTINTEAGTLRLSVPRTRDRDQSGPLKVQFVSNLIPPYLRRLSVNPQSLTRRVLICQVAGDLSDVLCALLGRRSQFLTESILKRLRRIWRQEWTARHTGDLSRKRFRNIYASIVESREQSTRLPKLAVVLGVSESGTIELLFLTEIFLPEETLWWQIVSELKRRGLPFECDMEAREPPNRLYDLPPQTAPGQTPLHNQSNCRERLFLI